MSTSSTTKIQDGGAHANTRTQRNSTNSKQSKHDLDKDRKNSNDLLLREVWDCDICENSFDKPSDRLMTCEFCDQHFCTKCIKMSNKEYDSLTSGQPMWFCGPCKTKVKKNITVEQEIETKCKEYMELFDKRITHIESELKNKCSSDEVKELIKEHLTNKETKSPQQKSPTKILNETVREVKDRQQREQNIIIMRVPENVKNTEQVNKGLDQEFVLKLCKDICKLDIGNEQIEKVQRLGKINEEEPDKNRPLYVRFDNTSTKTDLFKNLKHLKKAPEPYSKIQVLHDMTPREREQYKRLRDEAQAKSSEKEKYVVRGPPWDRKIVKLQKPEENKE